MRVGQLQRVIENVPAEEDAAPGVGREHPFHVAVPARRQERIDQHDEERADRADEKDQERRHAQEPAAARLLGLQFVLSGPHVSHPAPGSRPARR